MWLTKIIEMELSVSKMLNQQKNKIVKEIKNTPIDGVKPINDLCFTINFSKLQKGVLSPEYYSSNKQAELVNYALSGKTTGTSFVNTIENLVEEGRVKMMGQYHRLNDQTIIILTKHLQAAK